MEAGYFSSWFVDAYFFPDYFPGELVVLVDSDGIISIHVADLVASGAILDAVLSESPSLSGVHSHASVISAAWQSLSGHGFRTRGPRIGELESTSWTVSA